MTKAPGLDKQLIKKKRIDKYISQEIHIRKDE